MVQARFSFPYNYPFKALKKILTLWECITTGVGREKNSFDPVGIITTSNLKYGLRLLSFSLQQLILNQPAVSTTTSSHCLEFTPDP